MLAGVQGIRIIISIVFITAFIVTIMVEKRDSGVNGDTVLLNKCVTPSKFGPVFSTGQYCLLVGAGETAAFLFLLRVVTLAREHH